MPKKPAASRFSSFTDEGNHEYPQPSAKSAVTPSPSPEAPGIRTRVLSDKVPFSSRVSPAAQLKLSELVQSTGRPVTHLLDEALVDLFKKYNA